ncbi:MAG: DUF3352 domain-containing protein [Saprospiraceae bacterium]|nr:DUF3352 domain-containing protein [Saprospiraceae bacterium]
MKPKKNFFLVLIALILLLGCWHYFFRLPGLRIHPLEGVSASTGIVFSYEDGRQFFQLGADSLLKNWIKSPHFQQSTSLIRQTLSNLNDLNRQPFAFLLMPQNPGTGNLTLSAIVDIRHVNITIDTLIQMLHPQRVQMFTFHGNHIYRLVLHNNQELTLAKYRNLLMIAEYSLLVEESLIRLEKPRNSLLRYHKFKTLHNKQPSNVIFSIFVNLENLNVLLADWLQAPGKEILDHWKNATDWIRVDYQLTDSLIYLQGQLSPKEGKNNWSAIASQKPSPFGAMLSIIPDNTAIWQWMSISNARRLPGKRDSHFGRYILPWLEQEMATVTTPTASFLVCRFSDAQRVQESLLNLTENSGLLQSYQYQTFAIKQIMEEHLFDEFPISYKLTNPYFTIIENYVLFSDSRPALEVCIDQYIVGKTLAQNADFLSLYQKLQQKAAQQFLYINMMYLTPKMNKMFRATELLQTNQTEQSGQFAFVLNEKRGSWRLEGFWKQKLMASVETETSVAWKTLLDGEAIIPPMPIGLDALRPDAIAIQDSAYNLYLLDPGGEIIWKKKLDGPILSNVHSIAYYEENTISLLFNTAKNIYLLGMDGESQGAFPISLQTPATNGVAVIDFNKDRDYSFYVACANNAIYGFDKVGRPLIGWNPLRGVGEMRHPILHFQYKERDYLVALNEQGELNVYQRDGERRFAPNDFQSYFPSPPDFELSASSNRIVAADSNGMAQVVGMDGSNFRLQLLYNNDKLTQFAFADVMGDERKDYITLSDSLLSVHFYDKNKFKELYRLRLNAICDKVCAVQVSGIEKALVGVVSKSKRQIFLCNGTGKLIPGFPLGGDSIFFIADLFRNGQQILVVANGDGVYAYRIVIL